LIYHLLPVAGNGLWQKGVDQLRLRWPLFTGRKLIGVMTGGPLWSQGDPRDKSVPRTRLTLDTPDAVRRYLPADAEVFEFPNNPARWESASWSDLWTRLLAQADEADAVLYAHAKGVTRPPNPGDACQMWTALLYTLSLDYWPHVEEALRNHPIAGPFLKAGVFNFGEVNKGNRFHYSGNFWWSRVGAMRDRIARFPMPADRWAAEAWVGRAFELREAGRVGPLQEMPGNQIDFYNAAWINGTVLPAYHRWIAANPPTPAAATTPKPKLDAIRLSVIVPTTGRTTIGRTLDSITPQLLPGDEVIVIRDQSGDWGATPRTRGMREATGSHILFMDDDDVYLPDAFARIRSALRLAPNRPHLFQLHREPIGDVLWKDAAVRVANVSTQMFVTPNDPNRLGVWGTRYEGDYDFINSTCAMYPEGPVFVPQTIATWRPGALRAPSPDHAGPPSWWSYDVDSFDPHAWGEVVTLDEYGLDAIDLRGATVLDIGAHVGCFAWACVIRGAALVRAYEPEEESRKHLIHNATRMPAVSVCPYAIGDMVGPWYRGNDAIVQPPGMVSLDAATQEHVDLLKIDIEGGEWPAFAGAKDLSRVDRIVGEWHRREWNGRTWDRDDLPKLLEPHGFRVEFFDPPKGRPMPDGVGLFRAFRPSRPMELR